MADVCRPPASYHLCLFSSTTPTDCSTTDLDIEKLSINDSTAREIVHNLATPKLSDQWLITVVNYILTLTNDPLITAYKPFVKGV